jgi:hypothetical protein
MLLCLYLTHNTIAGHLQKKKINQNVREMARQRINAERGTKSEKRSLLN